MAKTSLLTSDSVSYSTFGTYFSEDENAARRRKKIHLFTMQFVCFQDIPVMVAGMMYEADRDRQVHLLQETDKHATQIFWLEILVYLGSLNGLILGIDYTITVQ